MKKNIRVLVSSAGTAPSVNIIKGLKMQKSCSIEIFAIDCNPYAAGLYLADHYSQAPKMSSEDYLPFVQDYCKKHSIDAYFSGYSKELEVVAENQKLFEDMGVKTLISSKEAMDLCNDKNKSSKIVQENGFRVPKIFQTLTEKDFPIIAKPIKGSGSNGVFIINSLSEFESFNKRSNLDSNYIFQEYIEGEEYTVDMLCDKNGQVLFCGPRIRQEVKAGLAVKSKTVDCEELEKIATQCCEIFNVKGVCNLQFIKKGSEFYFIEINPRFAGACILTIHAGANLPLASLQIMMDLDLKDFSLKHEKEKVMTRYWEEIIL